MCPGNSGRYTVLSRSYADLTAELLRGSFVVNAFPNGLYPEGTDVLLPGPDDAGIQFEFPFYSSFNGWSAKFKLVVGGSTELGGIFTQYQDAVERLHLLAPE